MSFWRAIGEQFWKQPAHVTTPIMRTPGGIAFAVVMLIAVVATLLVTFWGDMTHWFWKQPPQVQTPIVQSLGAVTAALITLVGVVITLVFTLGWNARKHREDRVVALKKDIFVSYLAHANKDVEGWLVLNQPPADPVLNVNESLSAIRLIAGQASREAVEEIVKLTVAGSNASIDARREITAIVAKIKERNEQPGAWKPSAQDLAYTLIERHRFHAGIMVAHATKFERAINVAICEFRKELGVDPEPDWFLNPRPSSDFARMISDMPADHAERTKEK